MRMTVLKLVSLHAIASVALIACCAIYVHCIENPETKIVDKELAVDATIDGVKIEVPFFDAEREVSEARRNYDAYFVNEVRSFLGDMSRDALVNKKGPASILFHYTGRLIGDDGLINKRKTHRDQLNEGPEIEDGYAAHMIGFILSAMRESRKSVDAAMKAESKIKTKKSKEEKLFQKEEEKRSALEFVDKLDDLLDKVSKAIEHSPMGIHIDWPAATFDGKPFCEIVRYFTDYLRRHAHGTTTVLETLIGYAKKRYPMPPGL